MRAVRTAMALAGTILLPGNPALAGDCRPVGKYIHCFSPPAPTPFSKEQLAARQQENVQRELAILAPLSAGRTGGSCQAAALNAKREGRPDLEKALTRFCGQ